MLHRNSRGVSVGIAEQGSNALCKVLIIDDDEDFVSEVSELLEGLGYPCVHQATAIDGLRAIAADHEIGIVLCDYRLPDMVGLDLASELDRLYSGSRAFSFILITGFANLELALEAIRAGIDDFLTKPIKTGEVARALRIAQETWRKSMQFLDERQEISRSLVAEPLMLNDAVMAAEQRDALGNQGLINRNEDDELANAVSNASHDLLSLLLLVNRERQRLLPKSIFGDPAWEISLELMKRKSRGEAIPVSSACTASCAPFTTSLRWVRNMEKLDLVSRWDDPSDKRRDLIAMSDPYFEEMAHLLRSVIKKWFSGEYG